MIRVKRALDWAAQLHEHQLRKYPGVRVPYMSHLAGVVATLSRHGFAADVVVAGALHDAIEDAGITRDDIAARFGMRIGSIGPTRARCMGKMLDVLGGDRDA